MRLFDSTEPAAVGPQADGQAPAAARNGMLRFFRELLHQRGVAYWFGPTEAFDEPTKSDAEA